MRGSAAHFLFLRVVFHLAENSCPIIKEVDFMKKIPMEKPDLKKVKETFGNAAKNAGSAAAHMAPPRMLAIKPLPLLAKPNK